MILDETTLEQVTAQFKKIYDRKEEAKLLGADNTDTFKVLAKVLKIGKKEVRTAFKFWSEQFKDESEDLDVVNELVEKLKGSL